MSLMHFLSKHAAVRSHGMATYHRPEGYDIQALEYIRAGKVNTMFIDPGNTGEYDGFDAAPYIAKLRTDFPNIVFVLYTWPDCHERFTKIHPRFRHFLYLEHLDYHSPRARSSPELNRVLEQCEEWHRTRFEYDVALSFAGEDRVIAEQIATLLMNRGVRVFYDGHEQANLLGKDLHTSLTDIYTNRSRYCVLLSSAHYAAKMWTSLERRSAQERALRERGNEFILPVRVDNTKIPGISDLIGYVNASEGAGKIVDLVTEKLWLLDPKKPKAYIGSSLY